MAAREFGVQADLVPPAPLQPCSPTLRLPEGPLLPLAQLLLRVGVGPGSLAGSLGSVA